MKTENHFYLLLTKVLLTMVFIKILVYGNPASANHIERKEPVASIKNTGR